MAVPLRALGRPAASLPGLASGPVGPARAGSGLRPSLPPLPGGAARSAATPLRGQRCEPLALARSLRDSPAPLFCSLPLSKIGTPAVDLGRSVRPLRGAQRGCRASLGAPGSAPNVSDGATRYARKCALSNVGSPASVPLDRGFAPGLSESLPRLAALADGAAALRVRLPRARLVGRAGCAPPRSLRDLAAPALVASPSSRGFSSRTCAMPGAQMREGIFDAWCISCISYLYHVSYQYQYEIHNTKYRRDTDGTRRNYV